MCFGNECNFLNVFAYVLLFLLVSFIEKDEVSLIFVSLFFAFCFCAFPFSFFDVRTEAEY